MHYEFVRLSTTNHESKGRSLDEKVRIYDVMCYYAANISEEPYDIGGSFVENDPEMTIQLDDWMLEDYGEGYYYFKIRPISGDITKIRHGEWSEMSPAMDMRSISEAINDQLDGILTSGTIQTKDQVLAAIEAIDKDELSAAMSADQDNSKAVQKIQELEQKVGVTTTKSVDEAMQATFDASKVTVVGAGLNAAGAGSEVELKIGKADEDVVIPAQYNNTVQFSMHLDGAVDADTSTGNQQLAVPVKIVLPVPAGVNPAFLVVLHYHAGNQTYDQILPYIYQDGGQWFASFVVDSFSNFALAEDASAVENGNGSILVSIKEELMGESTGKAIAAAYDEKERLLGTGFLDENGQGEIACDAAQAATVKVFLLDEKNAPIFQAAEINMKGSV